MAPESAFRFVKPVPGASVMRAASPPADQGLLAGWARFAVRRRRLVLLSWIGALVVLVVVWQAFGAAFASNFDLPGTESQKAADLLKSRFPQQAGDTARIVFKSDDGVATPATRARIEPVLAQARDLPGVVAVASPYEPGGGGVSRDGRIAYATVQYAEQAKAIQKSDVEKLIDLADGAKGNGLTVEAGGQVVEFNEGAPPGASEAIGVVAAIFILLVAFGSVVAMGLPLATAIFGLLASFALIGLGAHLLDFPIFITSFAGMIGIGVGIDYALFVVTRYREGLHTGRSVEDSVALAMTTAGRSVLFAGTVVVIAMLGLLANGIPFVSALGIAGAVVVGFAVLLALTLLPALLGFAGRRIDRWSIPFFHATDTGDTSSVWYRLSVMIQRRPLLWAAGSLALLLVLASPVLSLRLGFSDAGNTSEQQHSRRAYDLLAEGFGPGFNGPLLLVFDLKDAGAGAAASIERVRAAAAAWPGIAVVTPEIPNQSGDAAILTIIPTAAPQDEATQQLIHDLRDRALPPAVQGTGVRAYVAGGTAAFIDIGDRITERLPLFFGAVIGLSFVLLMVVFRSLVVALKAAVMNILSIGASFGVIVAVFQWGWLEGLLGVKSGPIETFLPMMLFAILFGLSMDYEVFLISRIREEYLRTGNNADAVAHGLAVTARVITAAAAIMVVVFLSFVLGPDRVIKEFGLGLATAIFVDATIVRLILVPATMELLGNANWWLPRWLDRLLPRLDVEGTRREAAGVAAD
jgi:RND superfamily putative drug exporter